LFTSNKYGGIWSVVYKKPTPVSLAIVDDFTYHGISQMNDPKFGDYDDNSLTDLVYYSLVGDVIIAEGKLATDKDFGAGYFYPVLVEDAKIITE
jgi:hypothetical protein